MTVEVSEAEMREAAQALIDAALEVPTAADLSRARDYLRAAECARAWLSTCNSPKPLTPFRCFVLGYLAAIKDRS
jgi:hypothetical protein